LIGTTLAHFEIRERLGRGGMGEVYLAEDAKLDQALEWMERGYESRDPEMPYIGAMPLSEELRAKPGFQDLLRRMNLPDVVSNRG
jgi:serine/threonine protein kinase